MKTEYDTSEQGINVFIYFRIPFTAYWLGKIAGECRHERSKFYLFVKDFVCTGWKWKMIY